MSRQDVRNTLNLLKDQVEDELDSEFSRGVKEGVATALRHYQEIGRSMPNRAQAWVALGAVLEHEGGR